MNKFRYYLYRISQIYVVGAFLSLMLPVVVHESLYFNNGFFGTIITQIVSFFSITLFNTPVGLVAILVLVLGSAHDKSNGEINMSVEAINRRKKIFKMAKFIYTTTFVLWLLALLALAVYAVVSGNINNEGLGWLLLPVFIVLAPVFFVSLITASHYK